MTQRDESSSRIVVIETSDHHWHYEHDGDYMRVYKSVTGDGLRAEVGYTGISEEGQHSIELPSPVAAHLIEWLRR